MHLNNCCVLFLLALVACQAAPSPKVIEKKSISEAEMTFAKNDIQLEDSGAEKDRAKKSATTFCVEVRSGKPEQVPCRQEVRPQEIVQQETSKPVVIVQPVAVPPSFEFPRQPIQPQPLPFQGPNLIQEQQKPNIIYPQPQVQPNYQPAPQHVAPVPASASLPPPPSPPIINIVPAAPAPAPCNRPTIVQPQQPQQIHMHHLIHSQPSQPTSRPSVTVIQQVKPQKQEKPVPKLAPVPQLLPTPKQEIAVLLQKPSTSKYCPSPPLGFFVQSPPTAFIDMLPQKIASNEYKKQEEAYACNCRPQNQLENIFPPLTPYISTKFKTQEPRLPYSDVATLEPRNFYRSMMIPTGDDPSMMPDQPIFVPAEEPREMEGRHHRKQYAPVNLSVQFPVIYPGPNNSPKYYEPVNRPSYTIPNFYTYPSSYIFGSYGNYGTYGTSDPVSYDSQASASSVPTITVNAGGPFYRESSQHVDSLSQSSDVETIPREALPTATEIIDATNNQKRETDIIQLENEQKEITQNEKE